MAMKRRIGALALAALVAVLGACGGGGGGAASEGAANPPPTGGGGNSGTGLVPPAPAAGEVLVANSAPLRPLSAGLFWQYRQFTPLLGPSRTRVTMEPGTAGRVIERSSDTSLADTELFRNAEGQTLASISVPLAPGRSLTISGVELPRELRAGQQFTVYDARNEGVDIAFWRVVAGFEDVLVPASPTPVRALRIDDRGSVRSGTQTTQLYGSTWYAPDIGVVRSVEWTDATRTATASDDRLLGFDGGSRGFGVVTTAGEGTLSVRAHLEDGYVTLNNTETIVADRRGRQVASGSIVRAPEEPYDARLLPTSAGLRVATLARGAGTERFNLDALDANGRLQGARLGTLPVQSSDDFIQATPSFVELASHRASPVIWMAYIETVTPGNFSFTDQLVVQRFSADGQALGPRLQWTLPSGTVQRRPRIEALADGLALVQLEGGVQEPERVRVRILGNDGTVRLDRAYRLSPDRLSVVRLIVDGNARWLAWRDDADGLARAWRLDADGTPLGVAETLASAQAAIVPLSPRLREQWPFGVVSAGGRWTIPGIDFASLTGNANALATGHFVLALFDPGPGDVRNQPAPALIRLEAGQLLGAAALHFGTHTLWPVASPADLRENVVIQWR
jgi:hypothetical protein